jgi:hypothetical protein
MVLASYFVLPTKCEPRLTLLWLSYSELQVFMSITADI